nr:hypothetical protein [uncultured Pseudomonas sp.]
MKEPHGVDYMAETAEKRAAVTMTAVNHCAVNDGACALILADDFSGAIQGTNQIYNKAAT